jgi:single-strand DNA-binding protein
MYNKVFLIGNMARDPEVRYTKSGFPVAKFAIAVNRPASKASGEKQEVDFINIVAWRRLAEICKEYLKKGRPVAIEGSLQIRKYEKDGEKRTFTEVVADNMQMLGRKQDSQEKQDLPGDIVVAEPVNENTTEDEEVPF